MPEIQFEMSLAGLPCAYLFHMKLILPRCQHGCWGSSWVANFLLMRMEFRTLRGRWAWRSGLAPTSSGNHTGEATRSKFQKSHQHQNNLYFFRVFYLARFSFTSALPHMTKVHRLGKIIGVGKSHSLSVISTGSTKTQQKFSAFRTNLDISGEESFEWSLGRILA